MIEEIPIMEMEGGKLGVTPLMRAATKKDSSELMDMLASGNFRASLFVKDHKGRTALDWARMQRNTIATAVLTKAMSTFINDARLDAVMDVNEVHQMTIATNQTYYDTFIKLIQDGKEDEAIEYMLTATIYRDQVENIEEIFYTDKPYGNREITPLMMAAQSNMTKLVQAMIEKGSGVDTSDKYGLNPLSVATISGHGDVVRALLFCGADIHYKCKIGRTSLHYACVHSKPRVVYLLIEFMYEKFAGYRMKHPKSKFDPTRCVCVCVCMCVYVCIYMYIYIYVCVCVLVGGLL